MADTNTTNQGLLLMEEGSHSNEWGDLTNLNLRRIDAGLRGYQLINLSAPLTLDATDITTTSSTPESNSHYRFLEFTGTSSTVTVADVNVVWMIYNHTGGAMTFQPTTGTGLSLPDNKITAIVRGPDGNNFVNASSLLAVPALTGGVTTSGDVATVVTNANLTGKITSVGNATTVNPAQTDITSLGTLTGLTVTGDVAMAEKADHTVGTPAAGYGYLWTKNTVPTQLYFTNDVGDDLNLSVNNVEPTLSLSGGAMTGAITTNSTFDGRDVAVDGAKLDLLGSSNVVLNTKVINIGNWNMDSTAVFNVAHGLVLSKIRTISVVVQNDDATYTSPLDFIVQASGLGSGGYFANSTNISMSRVTGSTWDSVGYDNPSASNRGWITIQYVD